MSKIQFYKGTSSRLPSTGGGGSLYLTTDNFKLYYKDDNTSLQCLTPKTIKWDTVFLDNQEDLSYLFSYDGTITGVPDQSKFNYVEFTKYVYKLKSEGPAFREFDIRIDGYWNAISSTSAYVTDRIILGAPVTHVIQMVNSSDEEIYVEVDWNGSTILTIGAWEEIQSYDYSDGLSRRIISVNTLVLED